MPDYQITAGSVGTDRLFFGGNPSGGNGLTLAGLFFPRCFREVGGGLRGGILGASGGQQRQTEYHQTQQTNERNEGAEAGGAAAGVSSFEFGSQACQGAFLGFQPSFKGGDDDGEV